MAVLHGSAGRAQRSADGAARWAGLTAGAADRHLVTEVRRQLTEGGQSSIRRVDRWGSCGRGVPLPPRAPARAQFGGLLLAECSARTHRVAAERAQWGEVVRLAGIERE